MSNALPSFFCQSENNVSRQKRPTVATEALVIWDKTPLPMNSMLQKEDRKVAVERRQARQKMEVVNVPPSTPCKLNLLSMYQ